MKVAIVHDYLNQYGGAERVLESICEIFPQAPVYTSIFEPEKLPKRLRSLKVFTSSIQKMPLISIFTKHYTFIYPLVFENFDFSDYDLVISSTANFAKGILVKPTTLHICYCHTPPRFLYHYDTEINRRKIWYLAPILMPLDSYFRIWDFHAAQRVDFFVTNSKHTAKRINKFYRREAEVIYPPVRLGKSSFQERSKKEYFLIVSRLSYYKRIDLAIQACNKLKLSLKIIGRGRDERRLKSIAGETIEFIGWVEDEKLADYYDDCQAVIFPGEDDFGIVPVEAMAHGKPVVAFGRGGALETVIPGKTGEFFPEPNVKSLIEVLKNFDPEKYNSKDCIKQAQKFSREKFKREFSSFVEEKWKEFISR